MRKLFAFGFLILGISAHSGAVLASNVEACDTVKDQGLHGLCVAWHNANPKNQEKIAQKYFYKSGGDNVPGSNPDPEEPPTQEPAVCPCTEEGDIVAWDIPATCVTGPGYDDVDRFDSTGIVGTLSVIAIDDGVSYSCERFMQFGGQLTDDSLSEDEYVQCVTDIEVLREGIPCSSI